MRDVFSKKNQVLCTNISLWAKRPHVDLHCCTVPCTLCKWKTTTFWNALTWVLSEATFPSVCQDMVRLVWPILSLLPIHCYKEESPHNEPVKHGNGYTEKPWGPHPWRYLNFGCERPWAIQSNYKSVPAFRIRLD